MDSAKSIWAIAGPHAADIIQELLGYALGWVITMAVMAIPFAILYFILKKLGCTRYWKPLKRAPGGALHWPNEESATEAPASDPQVSSPVSQSDVPSWQHDLMQQWQQEENSKRQRYADSLQAQRTVVVGVYRVLVYVVVGVLVAGALFFGLMASSKKNPQLYIVTFVLLGAAVAAYSQWNPSRYE